MGGGGSCNGNEGGGSGGGSRKEVVEPIPDPPLFGLLLVAWGRKEVVEPIPDSPLIGLLLVACGRKEVVEPLPGIPSIGVSLFACDWVSVFNFLAIKIAFEISFCSSSLGLLSPGALPYSSMFDIITLQRRLRVGSDQHQEGCDLQICEIRGTSTKTLSHARRPNPDTLVARHHVHIRTEKVAFLDDHQYGQDRANTKCCKDDFSAIKTATGNRQECYHCTFTF